ncbi:MAG: HAD family hydrolase [Ruminococcaceae bacterium]|nr:HAD family hydrolase [Oscillospiraceae bacterium]
MLFKHYIWDFDGTICDSYPHIIECFLTVLGEEGISVDRELLARQFYDCFKRARKWSGISDEAYERFIRLHYRTGEDEPEPKVVPFPEIEGILRAITEAGGDHYIYTNRNDTVKYYCRKFGLDKYFKDYITAEDDFPLKPAPDALLDLMKRHGLRPEDCVMIGDREIDGLSGVNAGMAGCLVTDFTVDADGRDPIEVSVMPYKCRTFGELLTLFEVDSL